MTSNPFEPFFLAQRLVVLDGGLATALEAGGEDLHDPLWSARVLLERPDAMRRVHLDYLEAGADCIATGTYQATFEGFAARGISDGRAEEILRGAVTLACDARDTFWSGPGATLGAGRLRPLVAASVGPYGAYLADGSEYVGRYDLDEGGLVAFHRRRWHVLAESEADVLGCETIPSVVEAQALLRLLGETPDRWAWLSFQCRDPAHLADGTPLREVAQLCDGAERVAAVGVNCIPPTWVPTLLAELRAGTAKPLVVYPNSGERYDAEAKVWRPGNDSGTDPATNTPFDLPEACARWVEEGARVLGGCCRTGPETIRRMRGVLLGRERA